ncbi:hypothetical protein PSAC2689_50483 [Paraburkholderia sacchari]
MTLLCCVHASINEPAYELARDWFEFRRWSARKVLSRK